MAAFFHKAALFHKSDLFHKAASFHEAALFHTATGESVVCGELPRRVFGSYISANKKPWQKRACVCHNCLSQLFVKIVLAPTRARAKANGSSTLANSGQPMASQGCP